MAGEILSVDPWKTDESRFPRSGSVQDQLAFCLNYAVLAPSIYNTQPWLFKLREDSVEVFLDRSRLLPATDPYGREMTISCGAALMNLIVAIHYFGFESWIQYAPERDAPDLIARIRLGRSRSPDHQDESLFRSIRRRRTLRRPFQSRPVPRDLQRRLIWIASEHGCWVHFIETGPDREIVSGLIEQAHQIQGQDDAYQAERLSRIGTGDVYWRNGKNAHSALDPSILKPVNGSKPELDAVRSWMDRDLELVNASPTLFVIGSNDDGPIDWVRVGQAMQSVLLHAESVNVSASFLNQPCQIPELREKLREITGRSGPPQLLLRMGYGTSTSPTPRKAVEEFILP